MVKQDKQSNKMNLKRQQFEGKKGRLLLQLQKSYKGDERFKLTQKFKDDIQVDKLKNSFKQIVDKQVLEMKEQPEVKQQQDEYQLQRKNQLNILNTFLPTKTKPIQKQTIKKPTNVQQLIVTRFDPNSLKGTKMVQQVEKNKRRKQIQKRTLQNKQRKKQIVLSKGVDKGKLKVNEAEKLLSSLKGQQSTMQATKPKQGFFMTWNTDKQQVFQPRQFKLFG